MRPIRLWPQKLVGQVTLILMLAVLLEFAGSSLLFERSELYTSRNHQTRHLAEQLVVTDNLLGDLPAASRRVRATTLATARIDVDWQQLPPVPDGDHRPAVAKLREQIQTWEPSLKGRQLRLDLSSGRTPFARSRLELALQMHDRSWLVLHTTTRAEPWTILLGGVGSAFILAFGVLIASVLLLRNISAPLRALATAANAVGQGAQVKIVEEGAGDLRLVAKAFNAMQARIADLITTRTHALAAVSHDLRTPLARMRLRATLISDESVRTAMEDDADEMKAMLESLLAYLGGQDDPEPPRLTDLAAIAMTLVDAESDAGHCATYAGPDHMQVTVRPLSIKRAIGNVVQNAILYGGRADLSLRRDGDRVVLSVDDRGPGIAEADMAEVIEPFQRLDSARSRNTGGLGLGLTIVSTIVAREGGTLAFSNRPEGGLRVEITLPKA